MPLAKNSPTHQMTKEERHAAWKTLRRDNKGRWIKQGPPKTPDLNIKPTSPPISNSSQTEASVQVILNTAKEIFEAACPRCAGDMEKKYIRCGPEKLIWVKKCSTCNFYIPVS
jgi:hypothetical protein